MADVDPSSPDVQRRRHIHEAIATAPREREASGMPPDDAYLMGWLSVSVYADPDGSRWFVTDSGHDGGDLDLLPWDAKGYIQHALDAEAFDAIDPDTEE